MKKSGLIIISLVGIFGLVFSSCRKDEVSSDSSDESGTTFPSTTTTTEYDYTQWQTEPGVTTTGGSVSRTSGKATTTGSTQPRTVRVTIPEGFTLSQIGDKLAQAGVCPKDQLIKMAQEYNFDYKLVKKIPLSDTRCFKLEGYLYPDTYEFYTNMKPQDAIGKMLRNAETKIGEQYTYPNMTTDQIITLASIIEKEAPDYENMRKISSVFHNRRKAKWKLQADATIYYVERYVKPLLTGDKNRYNSYYNTYKCADLPAGPICSPGANALKAAVNPADTDYMFFFSQDGKYYYSVTNESSSTTTTTTTPPATTTDPVTTTTDNGEQPE